MKIGRLYCPKGHSKEHHVPGIKDEKGKILRDPFCRKCRTYKADGLTIDNYGYLAFVPIYDMDEMAERYVAALMRNMKTPWAQKQIRRRARKEKWGQIIKI